MSKSKTSSKNNIATREAAKEFFFQGKKVKPVKVISNNSSILAAEYDTGDLVLSDGGEVLPWNYVAVRSSGTATVN